MSQSWEEVKCINYRAAQRRIYLDKSAHPMWHGTERAMISFWGEFREGFTELNSVISKLSF